MPWPQTQPATKNWWDEPATSPEAPAAAKNWWDEPEQPKGIVDKAKDVLSQAWESANKPLLPEIATAAHKLADQANATITEQTSTREAAERFIRSALTDNWQDFMSTSQGRSFGAGVTGATGDLASSFSSPASILMMATGAAETKAAAAGLTSVARFLRGLQAVGGAAFAASSAPGVKHGLETGDVNEAVQSFAGVAGGVAGVGHAGHGEIQASAFQKVVAKHAEAILGRPPTAAEVKTAADLWRQEATRASKANEPASQARLDAAVDRALVPEPPAPALTQPVAEPGQGDVLGDQAIRPQTPQGPMPVTSKTPQEAIARQKQTKLETPKGETFTAPMDWWNEKPVAPVEEAPAAPPAQEVNLSLKPGGGEPGTQEPPNVDKPSEVPPPTLISPSALGFSKEEAPAVEPPPAPAAPPPPSDTRSIVIKRPGQATPTAKISLVQHADGQWRVTNVEGLGGADADKIRDAGKIKALKSALKDQGISEAAHSTGIPTDIINRLGLKEQTQPKGAKPKKEPVKRPSEDQLAQQWPTVRPGLEKSAAETKAAHDAAEQAFSIGEANGWASEADRHAAIEKANSTGNAATQAASALKKATPTPLFADLTPEEQGHIALIHAEMEEFKSTKPMSPEELERSDPAGAEALRRETDLMSPQDRFRRLHARQGGAPIFHDVRQGKTWTRDELTSGLKDYINGGKPTVYARQALDAARARAEGHGVSAPMLPADAFGVSFGKANAAPPVDVYAEAVRKAGMPTESAQAESPSITGTAHKNAPPVEHPDYGAAVELKAKLDKAGWDVIGREDDGTLSLEYVGKNADTERSNGPAGRKGEEREPSVKVKAIAAKIEKLDRAAADKALGFETTDTLSTGEAQPRLPGDVGAVRDQEVAHQQEPLPEEENFLKPPASDDGAVQQGGMLETGKSNEERAADTAWSIAVQRFTQAQEHFRAGRIADHQFAIAKESFKQAQSAHDAAMASFHGPSPLPPHLAKSSPRYGYGKRNFQLTFADPIDKALYIVADSFKRSPADAGFLQYLADHGINEKSAREAGDMVREAIKQQAKDAPKGVETLEIPRVRPEDITLLHGGLGMVADQMRVPEGAKASWSELSGRINPAAASEEAGAAAQIVREAKGEIAGHGWIEQQKGNRPTVKWGQTTGNLYQRAKQYVQSAPERFFNARSDESNIDNISEYEKTGKFADAPKGYSEMYKASTDAAHELLQKAYKLDEYTRLQDDPQFDLPGFEERALNYIDNYVRRAFKFGSEEDAQKARQVLLGQVKRSLSASKSPLKGRVLDMPLNEGLAEMRSKGIKVEPVTTNPETLRQWTLANARQAWAYRQAWDKLKADGLIKFSPGLGGKDVPSHWVALQDKVATVFFPTDAGMVLKGKFYADPTVARILDRSISQGMGGSPTYRGIRTIANGINQVQLGFSGFHLAGTALRSAYSDLALGSKGLVRAAKAGDASLAARSAGKVARSATVLGSFIHHTIEGRALTQGLKQNAPWALKVLEEKVIPAGGRIGPDAAYTNAAWKKMRNAFANNEYLKGTVHGAMSVVEAAAWPIMHKAVPYAKLGAFLDLSADIAHRMPDASFDELHRATGKAWDLVDNRFGQMTYDNLFWNKAATDTLMVSMRSLGWNLGTVRDLGGGYNDILHGRGTDKAYYALTMPLGVMYVGAIYQYLHTGTLPQNLKDYFNPKNGQTDTNGNPERVTMPTEFKDVWGATHHPGDLAVHKLGPMIQMLDKMRTGQDFRGDLIRNPDDPIWTQIQQVAASFGKDIEPLSSQQYRKAQGEEDLPLTSPTLGSFEKFWGAIPAPREATMTPAMQALDKQLKKRLGETHRTPEEVEIDDLKRKARHEILTGKTPMSLKPLIEKGVFNNAAGDAVDYKKLERFAKDATKTPLQRQLDLLPIKERLEILKQLVDEKKAQLQGGK